MNPSHLGLFDRAEAAATFVRGRIDESPIIAIVLGSGFGDFADRITSPIVIPYREIPYFPTPTVVGHRGNLVLGRLGDRPVAVFQGRFHHYEGHDLETVTFPMRVSARLGVRAAILTAATGGINTELQPGDLVCLSDHLNLIGSNPLRGANDERFGPRFPDMSRVYSESLRTLSAEVASNAGFSLKSGVYASLPGPSYETPAEIRMLRSLGADVVGMSTVPEAVVARQCGLEVLAFALVSNAASGVTDAPISHEEVLAVGKASAARLGDLIEGVLRRFPPNS